MKVIIYLDAAATSQPRKEVVEAMLPYLTESWYNPSSLYSPSRKVADKIKECRGIIADYINANPKEIYFTSGGSESNSWAIQGFVNCYKAYQNTVITSNIEHKSILECVRNTHTIWSKVGVDKEGFIDKSELEFCLRAEICYPSLVSIQYANSEIGTVQDIKRISEIVHSYNGIFHTDATQYFGRGKIDVKEQDIDMLTASGHKIGVPKGIGFLYIKKGIEIKPLIYGSQNNGMRGGTENVAGIVGLAKAIELMQKERKEYRNIYRKDYNTAIMEKNILFFEKLKNRFNCRLNGSDFYNRLPNNLNITFPQNITGESLIYLLDSAGICISSGSACNSRSNVPSLILKAIGLTDEEIMRTIRITFPDDISKEEMDKVAEETDKAIKLMDR